MSSKIRAIAVSRMPGVAAIVAALAVAVVSSHPAGAVSDRVKNACRGDYNRFCPGYGVDTPQLRSCMRSAGKSLTRRCVDALVDSGEISRKEMNKYR